MDQHFFHTFEDEVSHLEEHSGIDVPPVLNGWRTFLGSANTWLSRKVQTDTALALPDPSLNLSLPFPRDELSIALGLGQRRVPDDDEIARLAYDFGIAPVLLDRPITALSGGERMLVSLCKTAALSHRCKRAFVCSPFFWLDEDNQQRVHQVVESYDREGRSIELLLLRGEMEEPGDKHHSNRPQEALNIKGLSWTLSVHDATVTYPPTNFPRQSSGKTIVFGSASALTLPSPTLLCGRNGVGKTTLAKALTGVVELTEGSLSIHTGFVTGRARLILQDPLLHLFGQDPRHHLTRVFRHDPRLRDKALHIYEEMAKLCLSAGVSCCSERVALLTADAPNILQAKLALAAERLASAPPLLVLDEPGWCLSQPVAELYLSIIAMHAHRAGTAVLLISHQGTWWQKLVMSTISLSADSPTSRHTVVGLTRE